MRGEDAGVTARRRADVEVELDVVLQPVASLVARHKYGPLVLLPAAAAPEARGNPVTQRQRATVMHRQQPPSAHSPEEELQLGVEVPDERAAGDDLGVAVVERQAAVAHVLAVDALGARRDTDDLRLLHVRAWRAEGRGEGAGSAWC